jgi:GNAT superfamily N-acetyltransferase
VLVRELVEDDRGWMEEALTGLWGSVWAARKGELVDCRGLTGYVAVRDGRRVGLVTTARREDEVEVVTLQVEEEGRGTGRALMESVLDQGRQSGARRIWLVTTNDNRRAIEFYGRWGMTLVRVISNGVSASRRVKPEIPMVGQNGVPVRDELEFELVVQTVQGSEESGSME